MEEKELTNQIMELRERLARDETLIQSLVDQQAELKNLVCAVQELALSMKALNIQNESINERLDCIEDDKNKKNMVIWSSIATFIIGAICTYLYSKFQ